jgi:outer membrane protein insertion porin family
MARHHISLRINRILAMRKTQTGVLQTDAWIAVLAFTLPVFFIAAAIHVGTVHAEMVEIMPVTTPAVLTPPIVEPEQSTVQIIEEVQVRGNRRIRTDTILINIRTKPGITVDPELIAADIRVLAALGVFSDIRAEVQPGTNGGSVVIFFVRESPLLRGVDYHGLSSISTAEILQRFRADKVGLMQESVYTPEKAQAAVATLKTMLAERGRTRAIVEVSVEELPPNAVRLIFTIQEDPQ